MKIFARSKNELLKTKIRGYSYKYIREHLDEFDWIRISGFCSLSENFIKEFHDLIYWGGLFVNQPVSEDLIREFQDDIDKYPHNWADLSRYQKLSEEFIEEFKDKLYWEEMIYNKNISNDILCKYPSYLIKTIKKILSLMNR